jgi:acylphosphatase
MGQTNWTSLGLPVMGGKGGGGLSSPIVVQNADGRLEVFTAGGDGNLWHIWQTIPGKAWSTWASLPAGVGSISVAARNADGRIEVFALGSELWHSWQTTPGNGWGTWASLGKPTSSVGLDGAIVCVESNPDGRLEVFAQGSDGALWHIWQLTPNGLWSSWASLGTPPNSKVTILESSTNADGRIEVFVQGKDGVFWHIWQTTPGESWSTWNSLGTPASGNTGYFMPFTVSRNADGRLEVFLEGGDGALYHSWQHTPGGGWGSWFTLDQPPSGPLRLPANDSAVTVAQNKDGHLEVLVTGKDGALWHTWQVTPGGEWGS